MSSINATTAYPLCPYCDIEVEDIDTLDYELTDEIAILKHTGTCPRYKRDFKWNEIYKWDAKFHDLEEISDP